MENASSIAASVRALEERLRVAQSALREAQTAERIEAREAAVSGALRLAAQESLLVRARLRGWDDVRIERELRALVPCEACRGRGYHAPAPRAPASDPE